MDPSTLKLRTFSTYNPPLEEERMTLKVRSSHTRTNFEPISRGYKEDVAISFDSRSFFLTKHSDEPKPFISQLFQNIHNQFYPDNEQNSEEIDRVLSVQDYTLHVLYKNGWLLLIDSDNVNVPCRFFLGDKINFVKVLNNEIIIALNDHHVLQIHDIATNTKKEYDLTNGKGIVQGAQEPNSLIGMQEYPIVYHEKCLYMAFPFKLVKLDLTVDSLNDGYQEICHIEMIETTSKKIETYVFERCGSFLVVEVAAGKISIFNLETSKWTLENLNVEDCFSCLKNGQPMLIAKEAEKNVFAINLSDNSRIDTYWQASIKRIKQSFDPETMSYASFRTNSFTNSKTHTSFQAGAGSQETTIQKTLTYSLFTIAQWTGIPEHHSIFDASGKDVVVGLDPRGKILFLPEKNMYIVSKLEDDSLFTKQPNQVIVTTKESETKVSIKAHYLTSDWNEATLAGKIYYKFISDGKNIGLEVIRV